MNRPFKNRHVQHRQAQLGSSLIEVLVTLVILMLGLLGLVGLMVLYTAMNFIAALTYYVTLPTVILARTEG